jgi:catechol 2,3-dioxygenase-like lactoylglutathione lyase family enzyme
MPSKTAKVYRTRRPRKAASSRTGGSAALPKKRAKPLNNPKILSHGTLECHDLAASRRFYEDFLGLDCVRHSDITMLLRKGGYWGAVCVEVGKKVRPVGVFNHWGMDMKSKAAVDRARVLALKHKAEYGIRKVMKITEMHGTYAFYIQDLDGNYWEFQYAGVGQEKGKGRYDKHFERGDIIAM